MKILVIGSGGREHALAWKLAQSKKVETVFVAPGNAGTAKESKVRNVDLTDHQDLIRFCQTENIAFTVVGPEAPLSAGIVDEFERAGLAIFGPRRYAAQLESSKDFAKAFMKKYAIPTADYRSFTDAVAAHAYLDEKKVPIVIKADGLAAGKGVVVAMTLDEAHQAVDDMLVDNTMGSAGARVVIEDFLQGEEASFIVMVDGLNVLPMATSQDHKRLLDNDQGPNTGGMGAYSPAPVVTKRVFERTMSEIIYPVVQGMQAENCPYRGFLYAGLMIEDERPSVVEFNCRFGDPETQPVMMRLESDFVDLIEAALKEQLHTVEAKWTEDVAVGVVLAAEHYPQTPKTGDNISGLDTPLPPEQKLFYAGAKLDDAGNVLTSGGRVLCACALGKTVEEAQKSAYKLVDTVFFDGMQYRHDIGAKAITD